MLWMPWMYTHWATNMQIRIRVWYSICKLGSVVSAAFDTTCKIHWFSQPGVGKYNVLRPVMLFHIPFACLRIWCRLYLLCFGHFFVVCSGAPRTDYCLTFCYGIFLLFQSWCFRLPLLRCSLISFPYHLGIFLLSLSFPALSYFVWFTNFSKYCF